MNRREHLLTIIAEECVEVAQRATKALRFGLFEVQQGQELNNLERLRGELADLLGALELLEDEVQKPILGGLRALKTRKVHRIEDYLILSRQQGTLED